METVLIILAISVLVILIFLTRLSHQTQNLKKAVRNEEQLDEDARENLIEKFVSSNEYIYLGITFCLLAIVYLIYFYLKDTIYIGHIQEWLNIVIRWMHITFGIAWIGTSFFFVFMENSLHKDPNKPELKGNLWMLHGGGFWFVEKYQVAPKVMPRGVHWFKYESYFTWLTGFSLLFVVYYFNAKAMLIDPNIYEMSEWMGISIGIGSLAVGYAIYHAMSLTPLLKKPMLFGATLFVILIGFAYFYTQVFNARAAYIHFGALIGTMMAGNVFFVIIPAQKAMVKATKEGTYLDPAIGQFAGLRSFHNNYFTLPVLFIMISNHFPSTFGHEQPWFVLALLTLASSAVKHYMNLKEKNQQSVWVMPIAILILLSTVFITAPQPVGGTCDEIGFTEVYTIFQKRCVSCHSSSPTDDVWTAPPNGVTYDTPQDIQKLADKIMQRVVITKTMPQNNKTGITPEERDAIRCWIEQGAKID
ncbi:MAG TPA: hypothetical protein ENJ44_06320 [Oceanospirillales bacterium]|nr:hypothetical protein [Oceanospirillales bacterium]